MNSEQAISPLGARLSHRHLFFALFSVLLLVLGADAIRKVLVLATDWDNRHASQILVVPFLSGWLIWSKRQTVFQNARSAPIWGSILVVLGGLLFIFGTTAAPFAPDDRLSLLAASLIVSWLGGFLLAYGCVAFRRALFPLLFFFLAVPIPAALLDRLVAVLQRGSGEMAYGLIWLSGVPIYRQGLVFTLPDVVVEVAPACSGIRSAIAIFICALIAGNFFLRSTWKKLFLLSVAVPVVFFKNAVRIAVLSVLAVHWDKRILTSSLHEDGGVLFFALGLCLLYPVLMVLAKSDTDLASKRTDEATH